MFREIITPQGQKHTLHLPKKFINKRLEVRIIPIPDYQVKQMRFPLIDKQNILPSVHRWIGILSSNKSYEQLREEILFSRL